MFHIHTTFFRNHSLNSAGIPKTAVLLAFFYLLGNTLTGCSDSAGDTVKFSRQIQPILNQNCLECHMTGGAGYEKSGLSMESYESLMKGTKYGTVIKPGDALSSTLVVLIEGKADPSLKMPHGKMEMLPAKSINLIKNWINQGAKNN